MIATTYGYVYVAQVAMGADNAQTLKAFREAEAYHGPSLIIGYAPCINHGLKIKGGMGRSQAEEARAVDCGYWHLWRTTQSWQNRARTHSLLTQKNQTGVSSVTSCLVRCVTCLYRRHILTKRRNCLLRQRRWLSSAINHTYVRRRRTGKTNIVDNRSL